MKREIIKTGDGSHTIQLTEWNEQYHSKHGAIQEAMHVFVDSGLKLFADRNLSILEIGFGTGLNSLITYFEGKKLNLDIFYSGVEAYPVSKDELEVLNYTKQLSYEGADAVFKAIHDCDWEVENTLSTSFTLIKRKKFFHELNDVEKFDLIYFDAFGARVQPELWTEQIFDIMYKALKKDGILVTYSAKGSVRRAMQSVGFLVEKLPGPPGKREMLRAKKV